MSRYPFRSATKDFMRAYEGVYAETTYRELDRRYRRIARIFEELRSEDKVSTTDPAKMSPEDVREFATYLRRVRDVSPGSLQHDVGTLQALCMYFGNDCVRFARAKYPLAFPVRAKERNPIVERDGFDRFLEVASKVDGPYLKRYAAVALAFGTGLRPCEIRAAHVSDLDLERNTMYVRRPKGGDSWASNRTVPVRPECRGILARYVLSLHGSTGFLFPNPDGDEVSENTLRKWRETVNGETGVSFDFRKCRRTYAQYLLDEGWTVDCVSVLLGHTNETTTAVFYGRARPDRVVQNVLSGWESKKVIEDNGLSDDTEDAVDEEDKVQGKGFEPSNSYENRP